MRRAIVGLLLLFTCVSCAAPRYQIPQSEKHVQETVATTEATYMLLYGAHKAGQVSKSDMANIDVLYESYRKAQEWLMDAVKAGSVTFGEED